MGHRQIIETGFMRVGKTTIGQTTADLLGLPFYDTDEWMVDEFGIDVPKLVREDPVEFRRREVEALRDVLNQGEGIISTGGGIVSTHAGRLALCLAEVPVVWLNAPFDVLAERHEKPGERERPLFSDVHKARELYTQRLPWYEETSTHQVDASGPEEAVRLELLKIALDVR